MRMGRYPVHWIWFFCIEGKGMDGITASKHNEAGTIGMRDEGRGMRVDGVLRGGNHT